VFCRLRRRDDLQDYDPFDDGGFCRWPLMGDTQARCQPANHPACMLTAALQGSLLLYTTSPPCPHTQEGGTGGVVPAFVFPCMTSLR
jgi:hypothetical protein